MYPFVQDINPDIFNALPEVVQRVGVFVNESNSSILEISTKYRLDYVQLHGDETPEFCNEIVEKSFLSKYNFLVNS